MPRVIQIWDDLHSERAGYFRAYWCKSPTDTIGCPVIGVCSPGGSHRTIRATAIEALKLHPGTEVYRNGKPVLFPSVSWDVQQRTTEGWETVSSGTFSQARENAKDYRANQPELPVRLKRVIDRVPIWEV